MSTLFVMLQERSGSNSFTHEALSLKYKLDNEFELIFVVSLLSCTVQVYTSNLRLLCMFSALTVYSYSSVAPVSAQVGFQKILTLTYVDKFIDDVQLHFRDRYKNELEQKGALKLLNYSYEFEDDFMVLLR